jgi:translation initiation factor 2-alpha kinase 4
MPGTRQIERCLVGATLAVSKLSRLLASRMGPNIMLSRSKAGTSTAEAAPRRCEVYVVSYTPGLIEERILVARDLWRHKVSADLIYDGQFR